MSLLAVGGKSLRFEPGTKHRGTIVGGREKQATDFRTRDLKYFKDGKPIMEQVLTLEIEGTEYDLYISSKRLREAVQEGFTKAGVRDWSEGDDIEVECTGRDGDAKTYVSSYFPFGPDA